ncbi:hypothetical protein H2203_008454 [Taxawa tesnikishii (nom. ined.)]|nr:hypothetical protein H2203_008454 [Dothideales sp. JES 119]
MPDKAMLNKMRPAPFVEIPVLNKLKRKMTESPEPTQPADLQDLKKRKLMESMAQPESTTKELPSDARIQQERHNIRKDISAILSAPVASFGSLPTPGQAPASAQIPPSQAARVSGQDIPTKKHIRKDSVRMSDDHVLGTPDDCEMSQLQQVIEEQFNQEIQLKHRELMLIEQELAKCQIALEQLRRCEIIPFPGTDGLSQAISAGTGPSVRSQHGFTQPQSPAPWGVTDGPYTRHYAHWLLPDSTFDPSSIQLEAYREAAFARAAGRTTRNSNVGLPPPKRTSSAREYMETDMPAPVTVRTTGPKNNKGPQIIHNKDGEPVKLVCKNCHRWNFSSVQGFLNHCRIAHKQEYKTHEEAATDCGQPVTDEDRRMLSQAPPPPLAPTVRTPAPKASLPTAATTAAPLADAKVHPFNSPSFRQTTPMPSPWRIHRQGHKALSQGSSSGVHPSASPAAASFHSSPLIPSSSTPYLTAAFAKRGLGGDLQRAATQAREKIDLTAEVGAEDDDTATTTPSSATASQPPPNMLARALERPVSRKGHRQPIQRPRPAPLAPRLLPDAANNTATLTSNDSEIPESPHDPNLSPHAADSNPGLVSDHDDDPASELEEDAENVENRDRITRPTAGSAAGFGVGGCGGDAMDVDVVVEDESDGHGVLIRPRSMLDFGVRAAGSPSRTA